MSGKQQGTVGHVDATHSKPVVIEWRNDSGCLMDGPRVVPVGRLIRTALADMAKGSIFAAGDTITFKHED